MRGEVLEEGLRWWLGGDGRESGGGDFNAEDTESAEKSAWSC
jgi:hypothetical protein